MTAFYAFLEKHWRHLRTTLMVVGVESDVDAREGLVRRRHKFDAPWRPDVSTL